ncbi:MAG: radical SAM family heme chaperone HemW [Candidatus Goldiibacteriota bacterium]
MTGLYVHIPYCINKCPYCDFVSFDDKPYYIDDYLGAVADELRYYCNNFDIAPETLFIGGGTPTSLNPGRLDFLFANIFFYSAKKNFKEITIEANPDTLTFKKAKVLKANTNRVSLGAQSFDGETLKILGRTHTPEKIKEAFSLLKEAGIENINIDIMYGIPGRTPEDVLKDIEKASELQPAHISFYMFTLYEHTEFYRRNPALPDDKTVEKMYFEGVKLLEKKGYRQYEISNFAVPGSECLHNLNYWNSGSYIGLGVSASSYFNGVRRTNVKDIDEYIKRIKENKDPAGFSETPDTETMEKEYIMLKLRTTAGILYENFRERFGFDFEEKYSSIIKKYAGTGHLMADKSGVCISMKGMPVSNSIISDFF